MKLFFETSIQARAFLSAVPLGLMLGVLLNLEACLPGWKALWDILLMLLCAATCEFIICWQSAQDCCCIAAALAASFRKSKQLFLREKTLGKRRKKCKISFYVRQDF